MNPTALQTAMITSQLPSVIQDIGYHFLKLIFVKCLLIFFIAIINVFKC